MRVDVHNHVIPRQVIDLVRSEPSIGVDVDDGWWHGSDHVPFPLIDSFSVPSVRLGDLERAGLDGAVLSPAPALFPYRMHAQLGARFARTVNEGLAEFCAAAPSHFRWMADVPMQDVDLACVVAEEAAALGARGIAIGTSIAGARLDEERFAPFLATLAARDLPLFLHPAFNDQHPALGQFYLQNVIGNPLETTVVVERMMASGRLAEHADLRLVLAHGGGFLPYGLDRLQHAAQVRPELDAGLEVERELRQLYFDTVLHGRDALRFLVERVGVGQVVLGTDMPFDMAVAAPLDALHAAFDEETVKAVAEDNPGRLYLG